MLPITFRADWLPAASIMTDAETGGLMEVSDFEHDRLTATGA